MIFPVYRKYENGKTFFKINTPDDFEELKIIGKSYSLHHLRVKIFPDRLLIQDMLEMKDKHWHMSNEEEYKRQLQFCQEHLKKI